MKIRITKLKKVGFCYGVKRAIALLEQTAVENGSVNCMGELVHNPQVMQNLKNRGIQVINSLTEITCPAVAISAHGVSQQVEAELETTNTKLIDATCPSVKIVQKAALRLAKNGNTVLVFGDVRHAEVKGILGWAQGQAVAALEADQIFNEPPFPHKIGILSQTTQVPENYLKFVKAVLDKVMTGNNEITILDTVCQEVRQRQILSQSLAAKSDLVLVVGGQNSANSLRLVEICSKLTETHLVEDVESINLAWLKGKTRIGITSGTSTSEESINQIYKKLEHIINMKLPE